MGEQSGDKSEEPTPHKLREARKKGQISKSKEVTTAALVLLTYQVFRIFAKTMWTRIVSFAQFMLNMIPNMNKELAQADAVSIIYTAITYLITTILPLLIFVFALAIIMELFQTRFLLSTESIKPKLEKISPLKGLKRMFSMKGLIMVIINLAKILVVAYITWSTIKQAIPMIISTMTMEHWSIMMFVGSLVVKIATRVSLFYIFIAIIDLFYQKHDFHKNMKMTKQEVKEEYKRLEGDPIIKQRQRQAQREAAQRRMMGGVPQADVVVTNPIHIACALKYDPTTMKTPLLVAKGKRIVAQDIKDIAEEHNIPIVENVSLARSLFDSTDVNEKVPFELYKAVAEVLAFVYKLKSKRKTNNRLR